MPRCPLCQLPTQYLKAMVRGRRMIFCVECGMLCLEGVGIWVKNHWHVTEKLEGTLRASKA